MLSALGQLGREPEHERVGDVLLRHAPTWLMQLPALVPPREVDLLLRKTAGATRERMLREIAEALEVLTAEQPLVLVLEDLHWSDPSTLELLSFLARRRQAAKLLIIGTYRPGEVLSNGNPLWAVVRELQLHRYCEDLPLRLLTEIEVATYLGQRLAVEAPSHVPRQELPRLIHQCTEGNPLFMVTVVDALLVRQALARQEIEVNTPPTIRQMIERQYEHLSTAEQRVLAVASVVGAEFVAAAVAAGTEGEVADELGRSADGH